MVQPTSYAFPPYSILAVIDQSYKDGIKNHRIIAKKHTRQPLEMTFQELTESAMKQLSTSLFDNEPTFRVVKKLRLIAEHTKEKHFSGLFGTINELFIRCIYFLKGRGFCTPVDTVLNFCDRLDKTLPLNVDTEKQESIKGDLISIYQSTMQAANRGYIINGAVVKVDIETMKNGTVTYDDLPPLDGKGSFQTQFFVEEEDTLNALVKHYEKGKKCCGLNMANQSTPGSTVAWGGKAQEQDICRRSTHLLGLKTQTYPLPKTGGIYTPMVAIFREDENKNFAFMPEPVYVNFVAAAATPVSKKEKILRADEKYLETTKQGIRNMLRIMHQEGNTTLVLGAWGCGVFGNPPNLMAELFKNIFKEKEFSGRFEKVIFAIYNPNLGKPNNNVSAFKGHFNPKPQKKC